MQTWRNLVADRRMPDADFLVDDLGSMYLMYPLTEAGRQWCRGRIPAEKVVRLGDAIAVKHRYLEPIVHGIRLHGLTVVTS